MATTVASSPEIFTMDLRQGVYGISPNGGTGKAASTGMEMNGACNHL